MLGGPAAAVGMVLSTVLLAGCSGSDEPATEPTAEPTPITGLDVEQVRLARVEFCDRLPEADVRRALGSDPESGETESGETESGDSWGNGDPVPGARPGDVAQEFGCAWTGPGGAAAGAWVFARPLSTELATTIVRRASRKGCTNDAATVFGDPAMLQACALPGSLERLRRAGLFGDTWLTCEVTVPAATPEATRRSRLDRWCATVVAALDTSGG